MEGAYASMTQTRNLNLISCAAAYLLQQHSHRVKLQSGYPLRYEPETLCFCPVCGACVRCMPQQKYTSSLFKKRTVCCCLRGRTQKREQERSRGQHEQMGDAPPRVVRNVAFQVKVWRGLHLCDDAVLWRSPLCRWRFSHIHVLRDLVEKREEPKNALSMATC